MTDKDFSEFAERALVEGGRVTVALYRVNRGTSMPSARRGSEETAAMERSGVRLVTVHALGREPMSQPLDRATVMRLRDLGAVYEREPDETEQDEQTFWDNLRGYPLPTEE